MCAAESHEHTVRNDNRLQALEPCCLCSATILQAAAAKAKMPTLHLPASKGHLLSQAADQAADHLPYTQMNCFESTDHSGRRNIFDNDLPCLCDMSSLIAKAAQDIWLHRAAR